MPPTDPVAVGGSLLAGGGLLYAAAEDFGGAGAGAGAGALNPQGTMN